MNSSDSEILSEYVKKKKLELYLIENQKYLYRLAISYVKNRDDAFEVIQNTIYKTLLSINSLKEFESLKSWVTRILINNCFDFLKNNNKFILSDELPESISSDNNVLDKIVLKEAIDKLPTNLKTIIILRFFEDFKIKDIANVLDMSESTVKTNLYKALRILKIDLKEDFSDV